MAEQARVEHVDAAFSFPPFRRPCPRILLDEIGQPLRLIPLPALVELFVGKRLAERRAVFCKLRLETEFVELVETPRTANISPAFSIRCHFLPRRTARTVVQL